MFNIYFLYRQLHTHTHTHPVYIYISNNITNAATCSAVSAPSVGGCGVVFGKVIRCHFTFIYLFISQQLTRHTKTALCIFLPTQPLPHYTINSTPAAHQNSTLHFLTHTATATLHYQQHTSSTPKQHSAFPYPHSHCQITISTAQRSIAACNFNNFGIL